MLLYILNNFFLNSYDFINLIDVKLNIQTKTFKIYIFINIILLNYYQSIIYRTLLQIHI